MSSATTVPHANAVRALVERIFEWSLFAMILTAFVALAGTGKLDAVSTLAVLIALVLRAWQLWGGSSWQLTESTTTRLTILYAFFYLADLFFLSGSFLSATVHLVLFIMVAKMFSVQRDRDHIYLAVIAFMMLLATAILTVDSFFLGVFGVFLFFSVATFITMEMRRSLRHTPTVAPATATLRRGVVRSLSATSLAMVVAISIGATAIFFLLPRISSGYLSAYAAHNDFVSGFSDDVRLGEIGRIQQSNTVVMHVQFARGATVPPDFKLRGVSLSNFDGVRWSNPMSSRVFRSRDGMLDLTQPAILPLIAGVEKRAARNGQLLRYRVMMEPIGTNAFFLLPEPLAVSTNDTREFALDGSGSVFSNDPARQIRVYTGLSEIVPREQSLSIATTSPENLRAFLELPATLDPRIGGLAEQVVRGAATDLDRAAALEKHLRNGYAYTLQLYTAPGRDPLAYFLFERKQGHCEYFASSMAVMLRTLGIPSRVVNGFRSGEFNDVTGSYLIRGRDAHSWVEAYIAGQGWVTFDPTPSAIAAPTDDWRRLALYMDAAREFWREWVINYDFAHQNTLGSTAVFSTRRSARRTQRWLQDRYQRMLNLARETSNSLARRPLPYAKGIALAALLLALLFNLRRISKLIRRSGIARHASERPQEAASLWLERLLRLLQKHDLSRAPAQTMPEFVQHVTPESLRMKVDRFGQAYESARFGCSTAAVEQLPALYEEIKQEVQA